jgi:cytochrome c1
MRHTAIAGILLALLCACGCHGNDPQLQAVARLGGDPARAPQLIQRYGCGGCHRIPGVVGAAGKSGPSLEHIAREPYISGNLPNTPENVLSWIRAPHSILPRTKMPELGLSEQDARDIAAYLWSLR